MARPPAEDGQASRTVECGGEWDIWCCRFTEGYLSSLDISGELHVNRAHRIAIPLILCHLMCLSMSSFVSLFLKCVAGFLSSLQAEQ